MIELLKYLREEKHIANLAVTACGTDEKSKYVHKLYRERFKRKIDEIEDKIVELLNEK